MTDHERDLIAWNRSHHSAEDIRRIQTALGDEPYGKWDLRTQTAAEQWQFDHGLKPDGKVGRLTMAAMLEDGNTPVEPEWRELTDVEVDAIIERTVAEEAGSANPYDDMNTNNEFEGWHDTPYRDDDGRKMSPAERNEFRKLRPSSGKAHRASQFHESGGYYIGLSAGILSFAQEPGSLGKMMKISARLDMVSFMRDFGPQSGEMLRVLTAEGKRKGLRGPRTQKIDGADMWERYWTARFDAAAENEYMRKAQRMAARSGYFDPAVDLCKEYGFSGQGELAVTFDMCVQFGAGGCRRRYKAAKKDHGDAMSILDVIDEIESPHRRERRLRIIEKSATFVHYENLVTCS